jgi:hypothetical protein
MALKAVTDVIKVHSAKGPLAGWLVGGDFEIRSVEDDGKI